MGEQIKIVALDDNLKFLEEIKTLLSSDYDVVITTIPQVAMQAIQSEEPAVVLLDMNMPEISGLDFLKVLRLRVPGVSVIMLTADSNPASIVESMKAGASDYVVKGSEDFSTNLMFRIGLRHLNAVFAS